MAATATINRHFAVLILLWNMAACGYPPADVTIEIDRPRVMEELLKQMARKGLPYKHPDHRTIVVTETWRSQVQEMVRKIVAALPAECLIFVRTTEGRDAAFKTLSENQIEAHEAIVSPGYAVAWEGDQCEVGYAHLRDAGFRAPGGMTQFPKYD